MPATDPVRSESEEVPPISPAHGRNIERWCGRCKSFRLERNGRSFNVRLAQTVRKQVDVFQRLSHSDLQEKRGGSEFNHVPWNRSQKKPLSSSQCRLRLTGTGDDSVCSDRGKSRSRPRFVLRLRGTSQKDNGVTKRHRAGHLAMPSPVVNRHWRKLVQAERAIDAQRRRRRCSIRPNAPVRSAATLPKPAGSISGTDDVKAETTKALIVGPSPVSLSYLIKISPAPVELTTS